MNIKSVDAFRTISEVADELEVPQHVLRFWESKFAQIKPLKRGGGRRYYRPDDVDLLRGIRRLLHVEGYTIKGVQKVLRDQGARMVLDLGRGTILRIEATAADRAGDDTPEQGDAAAVVEAPRPVLDMPAPIPVVTGATPISRARLLRALAALDGALNALDAFEATNALKSKSAIEPQRADGYSPAPQTSAPDLR